MGASRQNKNIWWYLFSWGYFGWKGKELFTKTFWRFRTYIFHDSFGKYWNRLFRCPIKGHEPKNVADPGEEKEMHCFKCEQRV